MSDFENGQSVNNPAPVGADEQTTASPEPSAEGDASMSSRSAPTGPDEPEVARRRLSPVKVITGAAVMGGGVALLLYRSPELRRVVSGISRDAEVRASVTASCDVIRKKWIFFGGPSALTGALLGAP